MNFFSIFSYPGLNSFLYLFLTKDPLEIIGNDISISESRNFIVKSGFRQINEILNVVCILSAGVIILSSLAMLLIVNYPKTVSQTKEKIANALMVIAFIAAFPLIADTIYSIIYQIFM